MNAWWEDNLGFLSYHIQRRATEGAAGDAAADSHDDWSLWSRMADLWHSPCEAVIAPSLKANERQDRLSRMMRSPMAYLWHTFGIPTRRKKHCRTRNMKEDEVHVDSNHDHQDISIVPLRPKINYNRSIMDKYTSDKASLGKSQTYDDVVEEPVEGKAFQPKTLSGSWLKSILLSVEISGIQRVTKEERKQNTSKVWNACTFWYVDRSSAIVSI